MMAIGVSYEDFWHGEPEIVTWAIKRYEITAKNDCILQDTLAWNIGRYTMMGVGVLLSGLSKGGPKPEYPSEPLVAAELDEQLRQQKQERELQKRYQDFLAVAAAMKKRTVPSTPQGAEQ